jgi:pathogenesis-related protein 1
MATRGLVSPWLLAALATVVVAALSPEDGRAGNSPRQTNVKVTNTANDSVFVAKAYFHGVIITDGWEEIKPNATATITAQDDAGLYLRVEGKGKEITFSNHTKYQHFPVHPSLGFQVRNAPDVADGLILEWKDATDPNAAVQRRSITKGDKMPDPWKVVRFFAVLPDSGVLTVHPAPAAVTSNPGANRTFWVSDSGSFQNTEGKTWIETSKTFRVTWQEAARTNEFVELYDKDRQMSVRLQDQAALWRTPGQADWNPLTKGGWKAVATGPGAAPGPVGATGSGMTAQEVKDVLDAHTQARAAVGVGPLKWSNDVAKVAQDWADHLAETGQLEHRQPRKYGENVAFNSTLVAGIDAWAAEKSRFAPGTLIDNANYLSFGHYTQMVWRDSTEIGVGKAVIKTGPYKGILAIVGNYNPGGNVIGQAPY